MAKTLGLDGHVSLHTSSHRLCHQRSKSNTCRRLGGRIPANYKGCQSFSDVWEAYQLIFPPDTHQRIGKGERHTNHMEHWYNRLRQSNARFVGKTLSFSKSDVMHEILLALSSSNTTYHLLLNHNPIFVYEQRFCVHSREAESVDGNFTPSFSH